MKILDFDKIYCLNLSSRKDRYNNCVKEFNKINLPVQFWYTCHKNIYNIADKLPGIQTIFYNDILKSNKNVYTNVFNTALEQYTIIKTSYERGFNNIAIMEDDIKFIDDINKIYNYLNDIPDNFDIVKFHNLEINDYKKLNIKGKYFKISNYRNIIKFNDTPWPSSMFYGLSKNGMKKYIEYFDNIEFVGSDMIFNKLLNYNINLYSINDIICYNCDLKSNII